LAAQISDVKFVAAAAHAGLCDGTPGAAYGAARSDAMLSMPACCTKDFLARAPAAAKEFIGCA
jgi:hypothetical protein